MKIKNDSTTKRISFRIDGVLYEFSPEQELSFPDKPQELVKKILNQVDALPELNVTSLDDDTEEAIEEASSGGSLPEVLNEDPIIHNVGKSWIVEDLAGLTLQGYGPKDKFFPSGGLNFGLPTSATQGDLDYFGPNTAGGDSYIEFIANNSLDPSEIVITHTDHIIVNYGPVSTWKQFADAFNAAVLPELSAPEIAEITPVFMAIGLNAMYGRQNFASIVGASPINGNGSATINGIEFSGAPLQDIINAGSEPVTATNYAAASSCVIEHNNPGETFTLDGVIPTINNLLIPQRLKLRPAYDGTPTVYLRFDSASGIHQIQLSST